MAASKFMMLFMLTLVPFIIAALFSNRVSIFYNKIVDSLAWLASVRGGLNGNVSEIPKFAVLRICFGLILLIRIFWISNYAYPDDLSNPAFVSVVLLDWVSALMITIGLATQWWLIFLMLFQWHVGEVVMSTSTLGNDVAAFVALLFVLTNSGKKISVDEFLVKKYHRLAKALLYFPVGDREIAAAKVLSLLGYWLVCVYSMSQHFAEPAWVEGFAGPQILVNNFMSVYWLTFEYWFKEYPFAIFVAITSMWIMFPWYAGILPFVLLGGVFRAFIIVWGILFFIFSTFLLQLGSLGEIEFVFWAALFLRNNRSFSVIYDDRCNLCDRTINMIKRVDLLSVVKLKPASKNLEWAKTEHGLSQDDVLKDLYGVDNRTGKLYGGYDFYLALSWRIVVLLPVWLILSIGKILLVGPMIYRFIADRRIKYFGVCNVPTPKPDWNLDDQVDGGSNKPLVFYVALHFLFFAAAYTVAIPAPFLGWQGLNNWAARAAHFYGIAPINVFNHTDIRMAENWFTLTDDQGRLLPVLAQDGSRSHYHKSDRIYFGGTLSYRRRAIGREGCQFEMPHTQYLTKNLGELYNSKGNESEYFIYTQYFKEIPESQLMLSMKYEEKAVSEICKVKYKL
ncbi:putative DCC family thiol-disulfide oxidoreductase YuxK [Labrenzia sp. EL_13]|nr:putative DCC family thiol-disulfide oxidoreductase YuxK [Labrenzia sp. EL_13]